MLDQEVDSVVVEILNDLKRKVESQSDMDDLNEKLNDKFMRVLDSSDSCCSSSSTLATSSDDDDDEGNSFSSKLKKKATNKKIVKASSDEEDDDDDDGESHKRNFSNQKYLKTKDEITIDDLPPFDRLNISLDSSVKLVKIGQVKSIVDNKLVVIQSVSSDETKFESQPLDEDTILFDSNRKALGKIYETFGPVANPFYSLRFNLNEIKEEQLNVSVDAFIFYAPESDKFTKFVFNVEELRKMKGSDASWNHDNEPPTELLEYSDDEEEQLAKRQLKAAKNNAKMAQEDEEELEEGEEVDGDEDVLNQSNPAKNNNKLNYKNRKQNKFSPSNLMKKSHTRSNFNNEANNRNSIPKSHSHQSFNLNYQSMPNQPMQPQPFMFQPPNQFFGFNPYMNQNNANNQKFVPSYNPQMYMPQMGMHPNQPPMMMGYYPGAQMMNYYPTPPPPQAYPFQANQSQMNPVQNSNPRFNYPKPQAQTDTNNNNSNIVDKRFIQNSNIVKKSF